METDSSHYGPFYDEVRVVGQPDAVGMEALFAAVARIAGVEEELHLPALRCGRVLYTDRRRAVPLSARITVFVSYRELS